MSYIVLAKVPNLGWMIEKYEDGEPKEYPTLSHATDIAIAYGKNYPTQIAKLLDSKTENNHENK